ncbi:Terminase small subunit [Citrobacter amalonaticus]|uniref:terminase small subunit n=1 Tax=Citrobacter amalonaticus TaxID=35703 RepID=UPI000E16C8CF|nr:terminase small subunit [Citrobacter amalonaticus]UBI21077.1 terminase small subunit [Citrobacter amalonaticus]BCU51185.1 terminase [Citrobacter amalonaticus]SUX60581.1 Terminase small subunit [Citrobacter amalonaticus]
MLTGQKKKFADALIRGENQTQSAKSAGYSEKTAKIKGSQLAKDKDVLTYMERVKNLPDGVCDEVEEHKIESVLHVEIPPRYEDPIEVMKKIMNDNILVDPKLSLEAAAKLAPYVCQKIAEPGKKAAKNEAAKKAVNKFGAMTPPKLVVNNKG